MESSATIPNEINVRDSLDTYQSLCQPFAKFPPHTARTYLVLGDLGESGEHAKLVLKIVDETIAAQPDHPDIGNMKKVREAIATAVAACAACETLKKVVRTGELKIPPLIRQPSAEEKKLIDSELGDGIWYKAGSARENGSKFSDIAQGNVNKLDSRKKVGLLHASGESIEERMRSLKEPKRGS